MNRAAVLALALAGCAANAPAADPCAPWWESADVQRACGPSEPLGPSISRQRCPLADGTVWELYSNGVRIRFANSESGPGTGEQLCWDSATP